MAANPTHMYDAAKRAQEVLDAQKKELDVLLNDAKGYVSTAENAIEAIKDQIRNYKEAFEKIQKRKHEDQIRREKIIDDYAEKVNNLINALESSAKKNEKDLKDYIENQEMEDRIGYGFGATTTLALVGILTPFTGDDAISIAGYYLPIGIAIGQSNYKYFVPVYNKLMGVYQYCCNSSESPTPAPTSPSLSSPEKPRPALVIDINTNPSHASQANSPSHETAAPIRKTTGSLSENVYRLENSDKRSEDMARSQPIVTNNNASQPAKSLKVSKSDKEIRAKVSSDKKSDKRSATINFASATFAARTQIKESVAETKRQLDITNQNTADFLGATKRLTDALNLEKQQMIDSLDKITNEANAEIVADKLKLEKFQENIDKTKIDHEKRSKKAQDALTSYIEKQKLKVTTGRKLGLTMAGTIAAAGGVLVATGAISSILPVLSGASFGYSAANAFGRWKFESINRAWNYLTCVVANEVTTTSTTNTPNAGRSPQGSPSVTPNPSPNMSPLTSPSLAVKDLQLLQSSPSQNATEVRITIKDNTLSPNLTAAGIPVTNAAGLSGSVSIPIANMDRKHSLDANVSAATVSSPIITPAVLNAASSLTIDSNTSNPMIVAKPILLSSAGNSAGSSASSNGNTKANTNTMAAKPALMTLSVPGQVQSDSQVSIDTSIATASLQTNLPPIKLNNSTKGSNSQPGSRPGSAANSSRKTVSANSSSYKGSRNKIIK